MAEKQPIIVVKKITVAAAGAHGGSWKVAFADFMTAMMAFFLVMWLIGQSDEVKKNVSDYFSTPSIIEYNFSNYGVELTLEKLFLDLVNEPFKLFEQFVKPVDYTPNVLTMGTKNIVLHHLAEKLGDVATEVEVSGDQILFEIPDHYLFKAGTAMPSRDFVEIMESLRGVTAGLEDSNIYLDSQLFHESVPEGTGTAARNVAEKRLDLLTQKIEVGLEHATVDILGKSTVERDPKFKKGDRPPFGKIKFQIKHKDKVKGERKMRENESLFGESDESMSVYEDFVKSLSEDRSKKSKKK